MCCSHRPVHFSAVFTLGTWRRAVATKALVVVRVWFTLA
jgi:hypothetical protein